MERDALQRRFARIALAYFTFLAVLLGSVALLATSAKRATDEDGALAPAQVVRIRWTQGAEMLAVMARDLGDAADEDSVARTVARYAAETVDGMASSAVMASGRPPWRLHSTVNDRSASDART